MSISVTENLLNRFASEFVSAYWSKYLFYFDLFTHNRIVSQASKNNNDIK